MRLTYDSRIGCYNLLDPKQESVSCSIRLYDDNGEILKRISFSPENEIDGNDPDDILYYLEEYEKTLWISTSRDERKEMIKLITENRDKIIEGNRLYRISEINKQIEKLQKEKDVLENQQRNEFFNRL